MPYTPASPLHTSATASPLFARESARRHRSTSCIIGVARCAASGTAASASSTYFVYPTTMSAASSARRAAIVMPSGPPGPIPTTKSFPITAP